VDPLATFPIGMRIDIEMPTGRKASWAKRLFAHVEGKGTDLAPEALEIDQYDYRDPELARREIFGRFPFMVAHGGELPNPGDFLRTHLPNNEALLVRQPDGSVRALVNVCRHRGARLVEEDTCTRRQFSCRYHGWGYRTDGSLRVIPAPGTFGGLDKDCYGLVRLPCEQRHGMIWVVDNPAAGIDVVDSLGPQMDETLTRYRLADTLCHRVGSFDEPINWKVLMDAFLDAYHIAATTHAGSRGHAAAQHREDPARAARDRADRGARHGRLLVHSQLGDPAPARPLPAAHLPAAPERSGPVPDGDPAADPRARRDRQQKALWDKNWRILMAVLRGEDMRLNRDLQMALGNADAPRTLLVGRNEVVNQRFHAWLSEVLPRGRGSRVRHHRRPDRAG